MTPTVGMIVPPAGDEVPVEAYGLYPQGVRFVARSLALEALTLAGYDSVINRVGELAKTLRDEESADVICLMGTSLSFFRGSDFNEDLMKVMREASGRPATTMSSAVRDALHAVGARRLAVGTAYGREVNDQLRLFLECAGFEILTLEGLDMTDVQAVRKVGSKVVADLALRVDQNSGGEADAILISCGGLPALHLAGAVEPIAGKPVIASATAGVWAAMQLVDPGAPSPKLGRLYAARKIASLTARRGNTR